MTIKLKYILFFLSLIILLFNGCSSGPNDDIVKGDIKNHFKKISLEWNYEEIIDIDIVGRKSQGDNIIVQSKVKTQNVTYSQKTKIYNWDVTLTYSKYGNEWRVNVNHNRLN